LVSGLRDRHRRVLGAAGVSGRRCAPRQAEIGGHPGIAGATRGALATLPRMKHRLPLAFALLKFVSGYFLIHPVYELQRDEYLYLNQGQHLAWGYLEVPPLTAVQGWATLALGGAEGWVKFWPFLWGAATVYLVVRLAGRVGGGWFAQTLAGICYLSTAFARLNLLFQPNSLEVLGFTACLYWLVCFFQDERPRFLYLLGFGVGVGLLNKYTTLFFIAALGGALVLTPARRLLAHRHG
jgi:hypothetical protein